MWKTRKEDEKPPLAPTPPSQPVMTPAAAVPLPPKETRPMEAPKTPENFRADVAHIGKSVVVKGELSGSEDLYLDGEVEGSIELRDHHLTVGPHGRVKANIHAKDVVVHGKVEGQVHGTERVELKKSAVLAGDIVTQRIVIEDGAYFKGAIDIQKEQPAKATTATRRESVTAAPSTSVSYGVPTANAASSGGSGLSAPGVGGPQATLKGPAKE